MLNQPKVSVIIPTYNGDRYLVTAIESVLNQTYHHWEIIIVDDGSTAKTKQILQPYLDKFERINYVYQSNQGVSAARNQGLTLAQGELIAFLDDDDYFLPEKLADQVAIFIAQPDIGIVNSGWYLVDENGTIFGNLQLWQTFPKLDLETWLLKRPVLPSAMMFKREWLEKVGGFDRRFPPAEDVDIVLRLSLLGCPATWLEKTTVCYRQHQQSATTENTRKQATSFDAVYDHFFSLPNLPENIINLESEARYNYLSWLAWRFYHSHHPLEMIEYLQKALKYSPYPPAMTVSQWLNVFAWLCQKYGTQLDGEGLANLPEWQQLINSFSLTENPRVSVIIATYNMATHVMPAIGSVFNQDYLNYEIIVVDDGSDDQTKSLLKPYGNLIKYIYQNHQGLAGALNQGLYVARGELIAFLEANALFSPGKLSAQIAIFDQYTDQVGIVNSGWCLIDANAEGKPIAYTEKWHFHPQLNLETWLLNQPICLSAIMVRRNWLGWVSGFDRHYSAIADFDLIIRLASMGCQAVWLAKITACYQQPDRTLIRSQIQAKAQILPDLIDTFFTRPDLPEPSRQLAAPTYYQCLVQLAWWSYYIEDYLAMGEYLQLSLNYSPDLPTETILNWLTNFQEYSASYGVNLEIYSLSCLPVWQDLVKSLTASVG